MRSWQLSSRHANKLFISACFIVLPLTNGMAQVKTETQKITSRVIRTAPLERTGPSPTRGTTPLPMQKPPSSPWSILRADIAVPDKLVKHIRFP